MMLNTSLTVAEKKLHRDNPNPDLHSLYDDIAKDWSRDFPAVRDDLITWPFLVTKVRELAAGGVVVDVGCGTGNICRLVGPFLKTVIGIDISRNMIAEAERLSAGSSNIIYVHGDMRRMSGLIAPGSTDLVLSIFGHCCLTNRSEITASLEQTRKILKPGGHLILQIPHPLEPFLKEKSKWMTELDAPENYFEEGVPIRRELRMANGKRVVVGRHHFPLTTYFDAIISANLKIKEFIEPYASLEILRKFPDLERESRLPSSLFMIAQAPPSSSHEF